MQGLTEFEHDIIGDIDHVVDRSQSRLRQSPCQPGGRWTNGYTVDCDADIAWAEIVGVDLDEIAATIRKRTEDRFQLADFNGRS